MTEPTATFTTEGHTPVLIEDWLPIRELGIESVRERQAASALPPLSFLHVWWARAPLAAASGVTLTALLPVWSDDLLDRVEGLRDALKRVRENRSDLKERADAMSDSDWYRVWVLWMCGVWGDTVQAQAAYDRAKASGVRVKNPFTWKQAYKNSPSMQDIDVLHGLVLHRWGRIPHVMDPTAGGGSIPFSSIRYGFPTYASDLNPVAVGILDVTLRAAGEFGLSLLPDVEKWGEELCKRLADRLSKFFPSGENETVATYLYVNTVRCPRTGGPVPLAPNWWLSTSKGKTAVRLVPVWNERDEPSHMEFQVESDDGISHDPDNGTVAGGDAVSPWDGLVVDGDYIKSEGQAGRMWPTLYAVRVQVPTQGRGRSFRFRAPTAVDLTALDQADAELARLEEEWADGDVLPTEMRPEMHPKNMLPRYGFAAWRDFFTTRQLLAHGAFVEEWRGLRNDVVDELGLERGNELMVLLAMMQGKALTHSSRGSRWDPGRTKLCNIFERHDFAYKWTYGEFEGAYALWPWCLSQLVAAYSGIAGLLQPDDAPSLFETADSPERAVPGPATLQATSASDLSHIADSSVECINIDPPYYDNVMYAELANFFYVWERRTIGCIYPERYTDELTNQDDEAIANVTRFGDSGRRSKELATFDYQQKMQAIFVECNRALSNDGVMVVWFTHKRAEAWDTLATAMMEAGFTIEASWPVSTQPQVALNHAKKNSAKSTIMLVCRKRRNSDDDETFFEDIEAEVRQAARQAVEKFEAEVGIGGVDLQLATYGPTLSVISRNWPVLSSEPDETGRSRRLRPEEALDVARQEVARLRMQRLVGKDATFDPATDFWLMCWETFQAREFPYDEARKLALGVGYDVDDAMSSGLLKKRAGNVELVSPASRGRALRRTVDDSGRFDRLVDAVHFMLVTYRDDKLAAARTWLSDSGYSEEQRFTDAVQAAVNAVPRVRSKKGLTLDEAVLLEDAVVGLFGDEVALPVEAEEKVDAEQMTLGG